MILEPIANLQLDLQFYFDHPSPGHTSFRRPCIVAYSALEPYGKISVNLPEHNLAPNQFFAKIYSENRDWAEALLELHSNWFHPVPSCVYKNDLAFPVYEITPEFINLQFEKTYNRSTDIFEAPDHLWALHTLYCKDQV